MERTKNYNLLKPGADDFYDVDDFNMNADLVDDELKRVAESQSVIDVLIGNKADLESGKVPETQLPIGTTSHKGIVQLSTSISSGSSATAATSGAIKQAIERAEETTMKMISNKNLLLNWDFRNPVNQRRQTSYAGAIYAYTIDRWETVGSNVTLSVRDGCITIANNGASTQYVIQPFEKLIPPGLYTSSIKIAGGDIYSGSGVVEIPSIGRIYVYTNSQISIEVFAGKSIDIESVKLELGPISTLANDPLANYGEQLALCQRYYETSGGEYELIGTEDGWFNKIFRYETTKRAQPTVSIKSMNGTPNKISYYNVDRVWVDVDYTDLETRTTGYRLGHNQVIPVPRPIFAWDWEADAEIY